MAQRNNEVRWQKRSAMGCFEMKAGTFLSVIDFTKGMTISGYQRRD